MTEISHRISLDVETYHETLDVRFVGAYRYAPACELMLLSWRLDGEPMPTWDLTLDPTPPRMLKSLMHDPNARWRAHNTTFERMVLQHTLGWRIPIEQWDDSAVLAPTVGLPAKLADLCGAMGMGDEIAKLSSGTALVNKFCKPAPKNHKVRRYTRENRPEDWEEFKLYCDRDAELVDYLFDTLPTRTYLRERSLWLLDQAINDRGVPIDVELAEKALALVDELSREYDERLCQITGGAVQTVGSTKALASWISENYRPCDSVAKDRVESMLKRKSLPDNVREALTIRQDAGRTSVAKYVAAIEGQVGGRLRGTLRFYGAARTGRWSGQFLQPQNMARPNKDTDYDSVIAGTKSGLLPYAYEDPLDQINSVVRAVIATDYAHEFLSADLANIEGRMLAWLAGEEWKLEAFRAYDAGTGPDLYRVSYARSFGTRVDKVDGNQRQIGKVIELALGYQGAVGAFQSMAVNYGVSLPDEEVVPLVVAWRGAHPATVKLWNDVQKAVMQCILKDDPTKRYRVGKLRFQMRHNSYGKTLLMILPSGRELAYFDPQWDGSSISYASYPTFSRTWGRVDTYGGKLVENATQAAARDVMAEGMERAAAYGFKIVLTVHDEIIAERLRVEADKYPLEKLAEMMAKVPSWADGLPLAAAGYVSPYYKKD